MTTRRTFLANILAAGVAPAAVGSGILMPVRRIITDPWLGFIDTSWVTWDPARADSLTRIALCTSDGGVRVLDLAWGRPQRLAVASHPIDADSPLRPPRGGVFNRL